MIKTVNEINPKADIQIAVLVDEKTLLLFGWIDRALPSSGTASFSEGADAAGTYDGHFWPRDEGSYWFVALLRFDNIAQIRPQRLSITGADRDTRYAIPAIQNIKINPWTLLSTLKEDMPEAMPVVFDFLHEKLGEAGPSERVTRLMLAFLQAMAQPDGFAEIFGCMTGLGALVQGWSFSLAAGERDLIVETDGCLTFPSTVGSFERSDLPSTARGVLGVLHGADTLDLPAIRRIYHKAAKGWCYLEIFENRTLLTDRSAVPHLRAMLPTLTGEPAVLRALKRLSNAQYEGFETISRLELPVRVGLDTAVRVPGAGTLVTGWVLDPDRHVSAITLKGIGLSARIDQDWCRTNRRDVSEAFAADALFAGKIVPGQDAHGFLAFVPEPAACADQPERYLELSLSDDSCAFVPVPTSRAGTPALRRLLSAVNLNDPAAETIISRHIGPLVQAAGRAPVASEITVPAYAMGVPQAAPRLSVVIPVADGRDDIDVVLAKLAVDRDFDGTEIVIAAGAAAHERLSPSLRRYADFYGLSIRLIPCPHAHDAYQAMDEGVRHAASALALRAADRRRLAVEAGAGLQGLRQDRHAQPDAALRGLLDPVRRHPADQRRLGRVAVCRLFARLAEGPRDRHGAGRLDRLRAASPCRLSGSRRVQPGLRRVRLQGRGFLPEAARGRPCLPVAADGRADRAGRGPARPGPGILAPDRQPRRPLGVRAQMAPPPLHPHARER